MKLSTLSPLIKVLIFIAVFILVIALLTGFIILSNNKSSVNATNNNSTLSSQTITPTTDSYAGWKEYRSEEYGIKFKYPSQYNINLISIPLSCADVKEYTNIKDCKDFVNINSIQISDNNGQKINIEVNRHNIGGDCSENEHIIKDINITFLNQNYPWKTCQERDTQHISAFFGFNTDISKYNLLYKNLILFFGANNQDKFNEELKIISSISIL